MPYVHTFPFRVRHYECDAHGFVHQANYLRYMQESAFDASAAVGYSAQRYAEIGYQWLAYETEVNFIRPLRYSDAVEIKTWVVDFRRVRSLRSYEFYRNGELAARAATDWVLIDTRTASPAAIPPEIISAYSRGEEVHTAPPRKPFTPAPPAPRGVFTSRRRVTWSEIDPAMHVNNAVYINYATDCALEMLRAFDWPYSRLVAQGQTPVIHRYEIEYKLPATLDDEIIVSTWASAIQPGGGRRHFTITRAADSKLLARVHADWGWFDFTAGRPVPISEAFLRDIAPNITPG